jgi:hypothetical protein
MSNESKKDNRFARIPLALGIGLLAISGFVYYKYPESWGPEGVYMGLFILLVGLIKPLMNYFKPKNRDKH